MNKIKMFLVVLSTAILIVLFVISILLGNFLIANALWIVAGVLNFKINFGLIFRKWDFIHTGSLMVFLVFGILGLWAIVSEVCKRKNYDFSKPRLSYS